MQRCWRAHQHVKIECYTDFRRIRKVLRRRGCAAPLMMRIGCSGQRERREEALIQRAASDGIELMRRVAQQIAAAAKRRFGTCGRRGLARLGIRARHRPRSACYGLPSFRHPGSGAVRPPGDQWAPPRAREAAAGAVLDVAKNICPGLSDDPLESMAPPAPLLCTLLCALSPLFEAVGAAPSDHKYLSSRCINGDWRDARAL
jgi:hypothetical protein